MVLAVSAQMQMTHRQPSLSEPQNFCKNLGDIQEKHRTSLRKLKVTLKISYSISTYKTNLSDEVKLQIIHPFIESTIILCFFGRSPL